MKTFIYRGDGDSLIALNVTLKKGEPVTTDDPAVIALLSATKDIEEVTGKKEEPKPTSRKDAFKS